MKLLSPALLLAVLLLSPGTVPGAAEPPGPARAEVLTPGQRDFMTWRRGLFIHFHLGTFADRDWASGYEDPALFAPARLDCNQWAQVAREAGMTYLVLTVKHTEGMTLYDSAGTDHDITRFTRFRNGRGDLVREFVDACRRHGLKVGLYYCLPGDYADERHHNAPPPGQPDLHGLPPEAVGDYVGCIKRQLTEMLTRYGPIDLLWVDQYENKYTRAAWPGIRAHIRSLQPRCVVLGINASTLQDSDVISYEYTWRRELPPEGNTRPSEVCDTIQSDQRWFWRAVTRPEDLLPAAEIAARIRTCNARNGNYLLNVPPDRDGLISGAHLQRLREIAALLNQP